MGIHLKQPKLFTRTLGRIFFLWFFWRRFNRNLDDEHPKWVLATARTDELRDLAVRVATEVPSDAAAVAAIRAAGGKPKQLKVAAAWIRANGYAREHRNYLRAARLLTAAADGSSPITASADEEALFHAVDSLEALTREDAFAALASEVPALTELEHQIVISLSVPGWQDRDANERVTEILGDLAQLVGPQAPDGSQLIRSHVAFERVRVYLLDKAGLLQQ